MSKFIKRVITGVCDSFSNEGDGVIHINKEVFFVPGLLIGENADVEVNYSRAGINYGVIKKLHNLSPDRIKPKCPVCTACGGCCFQNYSYEKQLEFKTKKVQDDLKYIGGIDVKVSPCIGMENPYNYRNKIQMPFGKIGKEIVYGFYKSKSHKIIPVSSCAIEDVRAHKILNSIKVLLKSFKIEPYEEDYRRGVLRHVLIRTSFYKPEIMVVLVTNVDSFPSRNNFVKKLVEDDPEITTVVQNINKRDTNVILGEQERVLYGPGFINDSLCGVHFRISAKSFYQINPTQTEKLYSLVKEFAEVTSKDIVLDAYSGIGTIGMTLAKDVKQVLSVEIEKSAVKDGIDNSKRNGINNIKFVNRDATEYIQELAEDKTHIDIVVMDPPRKGSTKEFIDSVKTLKPNKVVYVSCDPATLSRDLKYFKNSYTVKKVQPVDMFPFTQHVENVILLKLKV